MGLVLLPVCHIHQPALSAAGVLLSLQEEEDAGEVSSVFFVCARMACNETYARSTSRPTLLLLSVKQSHTHILEATYSIMST